MKLLRANTRNQSSGVRHVYQTRAGKWYAQVTKNGKTHRSEYFDHFDQARNAAVDLRKRLGVL